MDLTIEDLLKQMLNFFQNVDKELRKAKEDERLINQKQQDVLHYIEGVTLNAGGYAKAGKLLKRVRQERRVIKNTIERLETIQKFTMKFNNRMIQGDIIQLMKELSKIEKKQNEPKYECRTNILEELEAKDNEKE